VVFPLEESAISEEVGKLEGSRLAKRARTYEDAYRRAHWTYVAMHEIEKLIRDLVERQNVIK